MKESNYASYTAIEQRNILYQRANRYIETPVGRLIKCKLIFHAILSRNYKTLN